MAYDHPFWPIKGYTIAVTDVLAATDISNPGTLPGDNAINIAPGAGGPFSNKNRTIVVDNAGTKRVFLSWGSASTTVTSSAFKHTIPSGSVQTLTIDPGATHLIAICASGDTATLYVMPGRGY